MSARRFTVRPCDDGATLGPRARSTSWDVVDRADGRAVSNHDTRRAARTEARRLNATHTEGSRP